MKKIIFVLSIATAILLLASYTVISNEAVEPTLPLPATATEVVITKNTPVQEVLKMLGDTLPNHRLDATMTKASAAIGEALFKYGIAKKEGGASARQSKHFVCTSCHNIQKEDPDLRVYDPQARLEYVAKNELTFLQATTMYGVVDRRGFYNGDYYLKYGESVRKANNDLRAAIQLCAIECAQGRALDDWEIESILAYFWTIGLKMSDLSLSESDWQRVQADAKQPNKYDELIQFVKSFYQDRSPATFLKPPKDRKAGYALEGNPKNGKLVYDYSCKHCHEKGRYSFFNLDDSATTFKHLAKNFPKNNRYSLYYLIREGTYPLYGKRAYMPKYTKEKLTDQQIEDLRAYIEQGAS